MYRRFIYITLFLFPFTLLNAQDCNQLGAWLWHIEITGYQTHADLADTLSDLGIKRVYVKVADGSIDSIDWPELEDKTLDHDYN